MKVIFMNAAPGSGKDSIAQGIVDMHSNFIIEKFAYPLYNTIQEMFSLKDDEWSYIYNNYKELPSCRLGGSSPRNLMIWLSEEVIKPKFGYTFFGDVLASRIEETNDQKSIVLVTDSGFSYEAFPVVKKIGEENCFLLHIDREGFTFDNDSRSIWMPEDVGIPRMNHMKINNNRSLSDSIRSTLYMINDVVLSKES